MGTVEQVGLTTFVVVPIAVLTATFLNESSSIFSRVVRTVVDSMTGMPEIIAGLFVYLSWVLPRGTNGKSGFAGSMALGIMMLPFLTRAAQEALRLVPGALREASLALGAPQWRMILRVVLPTARSALITVTILAIARAVGETAAVFFTAGGSPISHYNWNPFKGPQLNLPLYVVQYVNAPSANEVREAWGGALVLVLFILVLFTMARAVGSTGEPGRRRLPWPRRRPIAAEAE